MYVYFNREPLNNNYINWNIKNIDVPFKKFLFDMLGTKKNRIFPSQFWISLRNSFYSISKENDKNRYLKELWRPTVAMIGFWEQYIACP